MSDCYQSIRSPSTAIYKEKGSKFLAFAYPVASEEEIKYCLQNLRKQYPDATHHCYAYAVGAKQEKWRANDDGEPSHSAGKPILGQIKSKNLSDVLVVVVRYYGGVNLGISGLIHAYKTVTALALEEAIVCDKILTISLDLVYNYAETNEIMNLISQYQLPIISQNFDLFCHMSISVKQREIEQIRAMLHAWIA